MDELDGVSVNTMHLSMAQKWDFQTRVVLNDWFNLTLMYINLSDFQWKDLKNC